MDLSDEASHVAMVGCNATMSDVFALNSTKANTDDIPIQKV